MAKKGPTPLSTVEAVQCMLDPQQSLGAPGCLARWGVRPRSIDASAAELAWGTARSHLSHTCRGGGGVRDCNHPPLVADPHSLAEGESPESHHRSLMGHSGTGRTVLGPTPRRGTIRKDSP
jgi:hypothetical protein